MRGIYNMKKILFTILLILFAWNAGAATYYVANNGTAKGATACATFLAMATNVSTPAKTIADMAACAATLANGDTIAFKRGDVWAERLKVAHANITFTSYGVGVHPIFTGDGTYSCEVAADNQTFQNIWFQSHPMYAWARNGTKIYYNLFSDLTSGQTGNIQTAGTADIDIANNTFTANANGVVYSSIYGSSTRNIRNNIFFGSHYIFAPIYTSADTSTYSNNVFAGGSCLPYQTGSALECKTSGGGICSDGGSNLKLTDSAANNPKFVSNRYGSIPKAVFSISNNPMFFVCLMNTLKDYGVKGTYNPYKGFVGAGSVYPNAVSATMCTGGPYDLSDMQSLIDGGYATATCRGGNDNPMNPTIKAAKAATISSTNTGDLVLTIDGATTKTLTLTSTGNPANNITIDWSVDTKNSTDLSAALSGKGWTLALNGYSFRLSSLKNTSCTTFPCDVNWDDETGSSRWYYDESIAATASINTYLGRDVVRTWNWPGTAGATNAEFVDYLRATSGLYGAAEVDSAPVSTGTYLYSYDVYLIKKTNIGSLKGDGSDAQIKAAARSLWAWATQTGGVIYLLGENTASSLSLAQTVTLVQELNALGVEWVFPIDLINSIKADHINTTGTVWTKTYPHGNYNLKSGSPAINAGINVGLTTDIEGKTVNSDHPEIGCYEYKPAGWKKP
jgi:hypothetical protein